MKSISNLTLIIATAALVCDSGCGFTPQIRISASKTTGLHAENVSRRSLGASLLSTIGLLSLGVNPQEADASYSAYAAREKDWEQRKKSGDVTYSTARDLRTQLREIAPMNDEGKMMFCPNGASAAVTPMMENRCGDRMAAPSVFGRTSDATGNSIPGFQNQGSFTISAKDVKGGRTLTDTSVGGFPSYK